MMTQCLDNVQKCSRVPSYEAKPANQDFSLKGVGAFSGVTNGPRRTPPPRARGRGYGELVKDFPGVARNVEDYIRKYLHFDHWVEAVLEGLERAKKATGSST
jgi:hypothetical protein